MILLAVAALIEWRSKRPGGRPAAVAVLAKGKRRVPVRRFPTGPAAALVTIALAVSVIALQGCSTGSKAGDDAAERETAVEATATSGTNAPAEGDGKVDVPAPGTKALVKTSKGEITVELYPDVAPQTVASFVKLARGGFYAGIRFHRVEPGFVVQGGDPLTKGLAAEEVRAIIDRQKTRAMKPDDPALGTGGPGFNVKAEFNSRKHVKGTVAMARSQDPDSAGSQFYICLDAQPFLDGQYTVFGQVVSGMDVVDEIDVGDLIESVKVAE